MFNSLKSVPILLGHLKDNINSIHSKHHGTTTTKSRQRKKSTMKYYYTLSGLLKSKIQITRFKIRKKNN